MLDHEHHIPIAPKRQPWNKSKLIGPKPPLRPKHVWSIRTKLQIDRRTRDLAMFNLAIDSKLRGCDVVALKVKDVAPSGYAVARSGNGTAKEDWAVGQIRTDGTDSPSDRRLCESRRQETRPVPLHGPMWSRSMLDNEAVRTARL